MRFQRDAIINEQGTMTGWQNGYPTWQAATVQDARTDFFVNDGSTAGWFTLPTPNFDTGSLTTDCVFEQEIHGASQIIIEAHINALGAAGLLGVYLSIEFQDPDNHQFWIPSREVSFDGAGGIETPLRDSPNAGRVWAALGVGNYLLSTRVEHEHFDHFRLRVRGNGAPDAATDLRFYWYENSHRTAW